MSAPIRTAPALLAAAAAIVISAPGGPVRAQETPLLRAMQEEMTRAMAGLRVKDQPAPYFIAYTIDDVATARAQGVLGSLTTNQSGRIRILRVEVRVGDYDFDSSRFISFDRDADRVSMLASGMAVVPIDDDVGVLRRHLWLTTDAAYKRALTVLAKKKAAFQNRVVDEVVPDFSREAAHQRVLPAPESAIAPGAWPATVRELSAVFLAQPEITSSSVSLVLTQGSRHFLSSEGVTAVKPLQSAELRIVAETQADDGMRLRDFRTAMARTAGELPPPATLMDDTRALVARLLAMRAAPAADEYTGPVLIEGQAASELVAQTLVPLFLSVRLPDAEDPRMLGPLARSQTSAYLTRLGARVLPEFLSVRDTPSLDRFESRPVPGAYAVDDEGMAAQDVALCEKGVLATLLTSRTPQKGLLTSNGHGRGGSAQAGVFQVESSAPLPAAQLRERFLARLKQEGRPFGYVVRVLANPTVATPGADGPGMFSMGMAEGGRASGPDVIHAVRITPDGKEEAVRGLRLGPVTHTSFKEIVEASAERSLYSYRASPPDAVRFMNMMTPVMGGGDVTVSVITPSLVFGELELQKQRDVRQRPPIVPSPLK